MDTTDLVSFAEPWHAISAEQYADHDVRSVDVILVYKSLLQPAIANKMPVEIAAASAKWSFLVPQIDHHGVLFRLRDSQGLVVDNLIIEMVATHEIANAEGAADVLGPNLLDMPTTPASIDPISARMLDEKHGARTKLNCFYGVDVHSRAFAARYEHTSLQLSCPLSDLLTVWNEVAPNYIRNNLLYIPFGVELRASARQEATSVSTATVLQDCTCLTFSNVILDYLVRSFEYPAVIPPSRLYGFIFVDSPRQVQRIDVSKPEGVQRVYEYYYNLRGMWRFVQSRLNGQGFDSLGQEPDRPTDRYVHPMEQLFNLAFYRETMETQVVAQYNPNTRGGVDFYAVTQGSIPTILSLPYRRFSTA